MNEEQYLRKYAERIHQVFKKYNFTWENTIPSKNEIYNRLRMLVDDLKDMKEEGWISTGRILVMTDELSKFGYSIYIDLGESEWEEYD